MHLRSVVSIAAATLLAGCASSTPEPEAPRPDATVTSGEEGRLLRIGEVDEGVLTEADPVWGSNGRFHLYRFRANAGDRLVIDMESEDFDTYLVVGDRPAGVFSPIASDDDSGGDLDSRVRFDVPATGTYWVIAQAYQDFGTGSYTILLDRRPALREAVPVAIAVGGSASGELSADDALDEYEEKSYDLYTFDAVAGRRYSISLASPDFDAYLVVGRSGTLEFEEIASNDDSGGSTDARVVFSAEESGAHVIRATSFDGGASGDYTLRVTELTPAGPAAVSTIAFGREMSGVLDETDQVADDGGYYDIYRFSGREGQRVVISMESDELDSHLRLGEAGDDFWEDYSDDDSGGGLNARIVTTLWRNGEYEIRAGSFHPDETGSYSVRLEEMPEAGPAQVRSITVGQTLEGSLDPTDATLGDDSYYDIYTFRASAGDQVSITLRSEDFDSYLGFGPWRNGEIDVTENDDDSGQGLTGLDAQIQLTIQESGTYAIRVNSLGAMEFGEYTLELARQ